MYGGLPCEGGSSKTEACIDRICPGKQSRHSHFFKTLLKNCYKNQSSYGTCNGTCLFSEPCCVANGVSDECLGLCVEETALTERFVSVCDKFADVVEKCTLGSGGNS